MRSDEQRGRFIRAGDTFSPFPDAVCTAELPAFDRSAGPLAAGPRPRANKPRGMKRVEIAVGWGAFLIVLGLFEKVVVADGLLAPIVERAYATSHKVVATADAWRATSILACA